MRKPMILIVDDEEDIQNILGDRLVIHGYQVTFASNGIEALEMIDRMPPDLVLLDIRLPDIDGIEVLSKIKQEFPEIIVIMITAHGTIQLAVKAIKLGAHDFIEKPFSNPDQVRLKVDSALHRQAIIRENQYMRFGLKGNYDDIIGKSPKIMAVLNKIDKVANSDSTVLITGETGTGKELVAKALHKNSLRSSKPFVVVNCTTIQPTLLESDIFGHEKGAFTGAISRKLGKIELAEEGTLFLDEIGDMAFELQAKLLRVIQNKEFERVGGTNTIKANVRFISATNRDLRESVDKGTFRSDLYYRINVVNIEVPPLRELKDDIPILIEHFIQKYSNAFNKHISNIADDTMDLMANHKWQGNIRELEHCIENIILLSDHDIISINDLPQEIKDNQVSEKRNIDSGIVIKPGTALRNAEKMLILKTLDDVNGNRTKAAKLLGISLRGLQYKLEGYIEDKK